MKVVTGFARGRARRWGLVAGVAAAGLIGLSLPASAHHADVSGSTTCADGVHVVHWTFTNSQNNMAMTIDSATAAIGATPYTVDGYTSPVANSGSTTATSNVPGNVTGTITATLHVSWPDNYSVISTGEVNIAQSCCECSTSTTTAPTTTTTEVTTTTKHDCTCETTTTMPTTTTEATTTTAATTTTHPQETTTTAATTTTEATTTTAATTTSSTEVLGTTTLFTTTTQAKPTTTLGEQGSTVPTTDSTTTTTAPIPVGTINLPRTGGSVEFPVIFGALCIAAGAALALRKRSAWSRS